jgi:hypothetical protein
MRLERAIGRRLSRLPSGMHDNRVQVFEYKVRHGASEVD